MKQKSFRGFTLIELLVVIAIIGILATVVIGAVGSARAKGADASIKGNLNGARANAELYYEATSSYNPGAVTAGFAANVCATSVSVDKPGILETVNNASKITGVAALAGGVAAAAQTFSTTTLTAYCYHNTNSWVAAVPLKTDNTKYWCVDSNGYSNVASQSAMATGPTVVCKI